EYKKYCTNCISSSLLIFEQELEIVLEKPIKNNQNIVTIEAFKELQ
ncbi:5674_t:CDS:1, partial [Gigaspora margarita]